MYQSRQSSAEAIPPGPGAEELSLAYVGRTRREAGFAPAAPAPAPVPPAGLFEDITPLRVMGWLFRLWPVVILCALLGVGAGIGAGIIIKPRFTAYSDMLVDPSNLQVVADDLFARNIQGEAQLLDVESKMRVITSTNVLARVVDMLRLDQDGDLLDPEFPFLAFLSFGEGGVEDNRTAAIRALSERVRVGRQERSYVVTVSAWARSPERAALIADALVDAFRQELAQAEADGAAQAAGALNLMLSELGEQAAAAERAVADFRRANGLQISGGEQLSAQSAVQINTQIIAAREATIIAEANYRQLTAGTGEARADAAAAQSSVIADLRAQYAAARQQADSLSVTLGPRHPNLEAARSQLTTLEAEIDREVARVVAAAAGELERARAVLAELTEAAQGQAGVVFTEDAIQVQLRQIERDAAAKVGIYEAYLVRAREITERRQLDTTNVRVISRAVPPNARSFPPRSVVLAGAGLFAGVMLGIGLAVTIGLAGHVLGQRRKARHG